MSVKKAVLAAPVSVWGKLAYYTFPYRARVIRRNIEQVYGDTLTASEKKHLIQAFYSHVLRSIRELTGLFFLNEKSLAEKVEVRGHEHMLGVAAQGHGVLVLTGHFGNWEFAPLGGILNFKQFKGHFHFIRRKLDNVLVERLMFSRYQSKGLHVIPKKDSLNQVVDVLEQNHAVVFVLDQHASLVNRDGIAVEFFGKKAGTYRSLASLSRHTGVPVVPAASYRLPSGKHVLEFYPPITWTEYPSTQEALYRNTKKYNEAIEQIILAHPEQWSWFHKRWKLKPEQL